jgi:hypothetical protein
MKPEDKAKVQQALDALEWFKEHGLSVSEIELAENSITALRQLLEQPVQEPMFYWDMDGFFVRPERAKFLNLDVGAMQALYANPTAQPADLNLNCKSVQARLATQWGYVKAEKADHSEQHLDMVDLDEIAEFCRITFGKGAADFNAGVDAMLAELKLREKNGGQE